MPRSCPWAARLEIIKDLGDAESCRVYGLDTSRARMRSATSAWRPIRGGHRRRASVLGVSVSDVAVVHNGQLTNYFIWKRRLERAGRRFMSECDSEIIAVYLAEEMSKGASLEDSMTVAGRARRRLHLHRGDEGRVRCGQRRLAAKPLVLYESDDLVALASEEIAIRQLIGHEIETYRTPTSARSSYGSDRTWGNPWFPHEPPPHSVVAQL